MAGSNPVRRRTVLLAGLITLSVVGSLGTGSAAVADDGGVSDPPILGVWDAQSLNGRQNNLLSPDLGSAGTNFLRIGSANYADGIGQPVPGPNTRYVSNRVFNDSDVNVYSERRVTQWGFMWGQFLDHTFDLRDEVGAAANIPFDQSDPLESFINTLGVVPFSRSGVAPGSGIFSPRQQQNVLSSYLDAFQVYGGTDTRLDWLREGSLDGNPDNNGARLLLPGNQLPRRDTRGAPATAPVMAIDGRLLADPDSARVAGDVRANEHTALTAVHTLFAREHNRIVSQLPLLMSQQDKFQIARAVVIAEQQYITYNEFLPAMGINLPPNLGYNLLADPSVTNEFATVGFRAHSMINGELALTTNASRYSQATLDALAAQGIDVVVDGAGVEIEVPLNVAFFNPDLVPQLQLGPVLQALATHPQSKNDELIDNQLRSVLFQIPVSGNPLCLDGPELPDCFDGVVDLGAIDIERGSDHGMPTYNQLRQAYGLAPKTSFTAITGETTEQFPADPLLTPGDEVNDPESLDVLQLFDIDGNPTTVEADNATRIVRRTTLAARLKAIYGSVNNVDAFTGMLAEQHLPGSELGGLQRAIWTDQFTRARNADRFFYQNNLLLPLVQLLYGVDYHTTLAQVIARNTDIPLAQLPANVFRLPGA